MSNSSKPIQPRPSRIGRPTRGVSIIEVLCACSVAVAAITSSLGGMQEFMLSQRLQAAAAEIEAEVQLARSTAILRSETIRLAIQPLEQGSCRMLHTGPKGACHCGDEGPPVCSQDGEVLHLQRHSDRSGVTLQTQNVSLAFSGLRGTVTPTATLKLTDTKGRALHQVVNVLGRTRTCSPSAAMPGYKPC